MKHPQEVLKKYWNYDSFRAPQEAIIKTLLAKKNVFALLPTGAGKSICFQVPALLQEGVCIVISPLVALMQDQVENLKKKGIKAAAVSANLKQNEIVDLFDNFRYGGYKFLYLSPERLQSEFIQEKIKQLHVNCIAIDEAHCISEWGHDFRPSYRKVAMIKSIHPTATIVALTASATAKVTDDIIKNLQLTECIEFKASLKRSEISYSVEKINDVHYRVKQLVSKNTQPSIIYTASRKLTKAISDYLNRNGLSSSYYHGGLLPVEKQTAYKNWLSEKTPIMVATNAFGMGIDKNNVATIIHANLPFSLENYMQESGRAGRNGNRSSAYLLYNDAAIAEFKSHFKKSAISIDTLKEVYHKLNQFYKISFGEKPLEQLSFDLSDFCSTYQLPYLKTFHAIRILEKEGILELSENLHKKSALKLTCSQQQIFQYTKNNPQCDKLIKVLLRTYGGLFEQNTKIDEYILSRKIGLEKEQVVKLLLQLHKDSILYYKPVTSHQSLLFLVPREDDYTINRIAKSVKQRDQIKQEKKEAVLDYLENNSVCRTQQLLNYFGENNNEKCGTCDVCLSNNSIKDKNDITAISLQILEVLKQEPLSSRALIEKLQLDKDSVFNSLQLLLDKNKIAITSQNKFQAK